MPPVLHHPYRPNSCAVCQPGTLVTAIQVLFMLAQLLLHFLMIRAAQAAQHTFHCIHDLICDVAPTTAVPVTQTLSPPLTLGRHVCIGRVEAIHMDQVTTTSFTGAIQRWTTYLGSKYSEQDPTCWLPPNCIIVGGGNC